MQVVGYDRSDPALRLASDGDLSRQVLAPGTDLAYTLGERHCAGRIDYETERHEFCANPAAPYCPTHTVPWSVQSNADSTEEHAVYLAAFAPDVFKVGVTRSWRLETRLREQGADRAAHIHTVSDGRVARDLEAEIARDVGDQVRVATKVAGLHEQVDETAWEALLADHRVVERFDFDYGVDLDARPVAETLLTGTVRATKGRILLLDRGGTTYAVDLRDLLGYEVHEEADGRALQSSLGSF
ncbi:DUF2797 domain-containing protein [Halomarina salina]|uniref:DUF2797 domain-containing protein n=1 Tax=Halomarina salina TaxID=1872699 RepID=A0ABD5RIJ5_9EURY